MLLYWFAQSCLFAVQHLPLCSFMLSLYIFAALLLSYGCLCASNRYCLSAYACKRLSKRLDCLMWKCGNHIVRRTWMWWKEHLLLYLVYTVHVVGTAVIDIWVNFASSLLSSVMHMALYPFKTVNPVKLLSLGLLGIYFGICGFYHSLCNKQWTEVTCRLNIFCCQSSYMYGSNSIVTGARDTWLP